jgi:hypothetical protein
MMAMGETEEMGKGGSRAELVDHNVLEYGESTAHGNTGRAAKTDLPA